MYDFMNASITILHYKHSCAASPVLLWLWFAIHGSEEGGGQLTLFSHLQAWVSHFDVNDGEILQNNLLKQSPVLLQKDQIKRLQNTEPHQWLSF